jgi:hypothetical protein
MIKYFIPIIFLSFLFASCLTKNVVGCAGIKTYSACSRICERDNVYLCEQMEVVKNNQAWQSLSQQMNHMQQQQQHRELQNQLRQQQFQQQWQQQNKTYNCREVGYNQYQCN